MAHKGVWLARCAHMEGNVCRCPNNETRQGRSWRPAVGPVVAGQIAPPKNPEFTWTEFTKQTCEPVVTINITQPLPRFELSGLHRKIIRKASKEATLFVQGRKPVLPQRNSLACIALRRIVDDETGEWETAKVCFELKSFYVKGVLVEERFHELRKSTSATRLVEGSIALVCGESYFELFGRENPPVLLSDHAMVDAFWSFMDLAPNVEQHVFQEAARHIGMLSLIFIEPSRQKDVMDKLCNGDPSSSEYFTVDGPCWEIVHMWDARSKTAKGIEYDNDENTVEEKIRPPEQTLDAIKQLNVVNSTKNLPVKKIRHTRSRVLD